MSNHNLNYPHQSRPKLPPVPPQLKQSIQKSYQPPQVQNDYRSPLAVTQHLQVNQHRFTPSGSVPSSYNSLTPLNLRQIDELEFDPPIRPHTVEPNTSYNLPFIPSPSNHSLDLNLFHQPPDLSLDTVFLPAPSPNNRSQSNSPIPPPISLPIVDLDLLATLHHQYFKLQPDPLNQLQWASKVFRFIERSQAVDPAVHPSPDPSSNQHSPSKISDPALVKYTDIALKTVLRLAESAPPQSLILGEALYLRGDLSTTGSFPSYCPQDPKLAFRDFEAAARLGCHLAWFRIGREYEACQDWDRALGAYEHGLAFEECACIYRLGVSHLIGQLNLPVDMAQAVVYLKKAAQLANEESPQPAYTYGMMLAGEFDSLPSVPPEICPINLSEARQMIEKAAYLGFSAAQYKLGWCYEYSQFTCPFDPLLSVEFYSLASKQGECEADMALSKWFLCGAEGYFVSNEQLAVTFAEKAAKKGLGSAMFALGYYLEVGIGGQHDMQAALHWYQRSWDETGNEDARDRLDNLADGGNMLSRQQYEQQLDSKLVRKHTIAAEQNPVSQMKAPSRLKRRETMQRVEEARRVAEMGIMARSTNSPHARTGSGSPSPTVGSMPTTPNSAQYYSSPSRNGFQNQAMSGINQRMNRSQSPTPPHLISRQPSLDPSSLSGSNHKPPLDRHGSSNGPAPRLINRLNAFQLTDDGPQVPNANSSITHHASSDSPASKNKTQFNSFADMGIQTVKAKKTEDCIIV